MKTTTMTQKKLTQFFTIFLLVVVSAFKLQASPLSSTTTSAGKSYSTVETNRIWLNVTGSNGAFSQTLFGYRAGATDGYDPGLDAAYWNNGAIALASMIGDVRYAIQFKGLPFSDSDIVPLSFTATLNGTYTFAIDHMDGFFLNQSFLVYLYDTSTGTYTNLKSGNYTFTCNSGLFNNRFKLTYSSTLGTENAQFTAENLEIYHVNQSIVIKSGNTILNNLQLYTLNGKILYDTKNIQATETIISNLNISQQTIVVRATTNDGIIINKKWIYL
jgi:hypothetical protein